MAEIQKTYNLFDDVRHIIEQGRTTAYTAVEQSVIVTNWLLQRIVEEEQEGETIAQYGKKLIKELAEKLVPLYGNSYSKRNLDYYRRFYLEFPEIEIVNTRVHNLTWSHFRRLLSVTNVSARE